MGRLYVFSRYIHCFLYKSRCYPVKVMLSFRVNFNPSSTGIHPALHDFSGGRRPTDLYSRYGGLIDADQLCQPRLSEASFQSNTA